MLRYLIEDWERKEHLKRGYDMVMGPRFSKLICGRNPAILITIAKICILLKWMNKFTASSQ